MKHRKSVFDDNEELPQLAWHRHAGFAIVAALIIIAVVFVIPYVYTANPIACGSCHKMKPYYESWRSSAHRAATGSCIDCHAPQDPVGLFLYRVMFYREIAAQLAGADLKPWGTTIPGTASCHRSACHSLNRLTSTSGELKINHRAHLSKRLSCRSCHAGVVHEGVNGRTMLPARALCKRCHAARMNDCRFCHSRQWGPRPEDEAH